MVRSVYTTRKYKEPRQVLRCSKKKGPRCSNNWQESLIEGKTHKNHTVSRITATFFCDYLETTFFYLVSISKTIGPIDFYTIFKYFYTIPIFFLRLTIISLWSNRISMLFLKQHYLRIIKFFYVKWQWFTCRNIRACRAKGLRGNFCSAAICFIFLRKFIWGIRKAVSYVLLKIQMFRFILSSLWIFFKCTHFRATRVARPLNALTLGHFLR